MANLPNAIADGDGAFYRVNTRLPAHELAPGTAAHAANKRFEDGRAWPRLNVEQQGWGIVGGWPNYAIPFVNQQVNLYATLMAKEAADPNYGGQPMACDTYQISDYYAHAGSLSDRDGEASRNSAGVGNTLSPALHANPNAIPVGGRQQIVFATVAVILHVSDDGDTKIVALSAAIPPGATSCTLTDNGFVFTFGDGVCGYARFNDPNGFDVVVAVTADWRNQPGEDGGRGRAWRIQSGNAPVAIPLNGHDVDGTCRLIACFNGLVLLRQGNERHYFNGAAVLNTGAIQLNAAPAWANGDLVFLWGDPAVGSAFTAGANPPALMQQVFVKNLANKQVGLYSDAALAKPYVPTAAIGRFYLERQAAQPGYYGNGYPPLLAQPDATGATLWDLGFAAVPVNLQVSNTVAATNVWTVANHRLIPGDAVTLANMPGGHTPANGAYFAYPLSDHTLQLFDTQTNALLAANGSTAGLKVISNDGENLPTLVKTTASATPMPPAREGYYAENNRLVLINGANNVLISDPLDPLHYTPLSAELTANLGEADGITAVSSISQSDALIFLKPNSIIALYNFSGGPPQWLLRSVTREYGCVAPLSVQPWGVNLLFLSRRGYDRVVESAFGVIQPVPKPASYDVDKYINQIDWVAAGQCAAATWNNRLFVALPGKGQPIGAKVNNLVLVCNFLNTDFAKDEFGWEGVWTGAGLRVSGWARHNVFGEERLTFLNTTGQVGWLGDGWLDAGGLPIADALLTRRYTGKSMRRKIWQQADVIWDTSNAQLTVAAQAPGWNEAYALLTAQAYNPTQYLAAGQPAYNPATQVPPFNQPFRADYTPQVPGELIGGQPDIHQNITEKLRLRVDDWGLQLLITNARGSCRLQAVEVRGVTGPAAGTRTV